MRQITLKNTPIATTKTDCMVIFIGPGNTLGKAGKTVNQACKQQLSKHLKTIEFPNQLGAWALLTASESIAANSLLCFGYGEVNEPSSTSAAQKNTALTAGQIKTLCQKLNELLSHLHFKQCHLLTDDLPFNDQGLEQFTRALIQTHYTFSRFKTQSKPEKNNRTKNISIQFLTQKPLAPPKNQLKYAQAVSKGMQLAQDLGNTPGNHCQPNFLVQQARSLARQHGQVTCKVLNEKQLEQMGANAFVAVSKGSAQGGHLISLEYKGSKQAPIVLVGKGITFDSGGISIKPSAKMDEMKFDMCGAASVFGVIQTIATLKLPIHVVGVIAAAENMPSGHATRPGDVVKTLSGQTVEILNTDAEGRLVLCDALTYIERYKPKVVIDIATLTGACIVALGHHQSAVIGNDQSLIDQLTLAGTLSGDPCWQLPLNSDYEAQLESKVADMANIGVGGAGTITAAAFLSKFTKKYTWAHLDIAGTAWQNKSASGRPVPMLCQYLNGLIKK